jgi:hypothetical protein
MLDQAREEAILMTTYVPEVRGHRRPHVSPWLVAVIVLAVALVGLGTWVLVDRYTGGDTATEDATALLDDFYGAASAQDGKALAARLASGAVFWTDGTTISGPKKIVNEILTTPGLKVERLAPVTVEGDFASTFIAFTVPAAGLDKAPAAEVIQLKDGKIYRVWDFGLGVTPPLDNTAIP